MSQIVPFAIRLAVLVAVIATDMRYHWAGNGFIAGVAALAASMLAAILFDKVARIARRIGLLPR